LPEQAYKSQYLLGRLATTQGDLEQAAEHYDLAIGQIEHMLGDLVYDLSSSFLHTVWDIYEDRIALCLQRAQAEQAFDYLECVRSLALRQYLRTSRTLQDERRAQGTLMRSSLSSAHSPEVAKLMGELAAWQEKYRAYSTQLATYTLSTSSRVDRSVLQKELKQCEGKLSELVERLYLHEADKRSPAHVKQPETRNSQPVGITQLRQHLGPDQVLLAYLFCHGRLVIFVVTADRLITHEVADGVAQVEHLLTLLHAHLQPQGWPNLLQPPQQPIRHLLHKLYTLLVAPVREGMPPSSGLLTIVPYGPLHTLPFHALYDGSHFLIERFQINYLPASSILTYLRVIRGKQEGSSTQLPLVFGYSGNGHMPRALAEAKTIATVLSGRCYVEQEATVARLIAQAPGSPIIHVAAHGQSRLDAPNFSYMRLADGHLNALDIFSLNLEECELVTLSGCETGLALNGGGDEQLGFGRAFLAAGARSLVMSLWSVEDTATNELMDLFYQRLLSGDGKGEALRAAQCRFLHRTTSSYSHPYFWAAFRLVGDVGPLYPETATPKIDQETLRS
jgi:CHAT domain-containing protein